MKYACLIYGDEAMLHKMPKEELGKMAVEYKTFTEDLQKSGRYIASHGLAATQNATTVRVRNGKTMVTDGPFIETKEQLASIYVVDAKDLDEAIQVASKIPSARFGGIEVRPLWGEA